MSKLTIYDGWCGNEAEGAWPIGSIVTKTRNRPGDSHRVGAKAKVLGSMGPLNSAALDEGGEAIGDYFYMLEWEDMPGVPVACLSGVLELSQ